MNEIVQMTQMVQMNKIVQMTQMVQLVQMAQIFTMAKMPIIGPNGPNENLLLSCENNKIIIWDR